MYRKCSWHTTADLCTKYKLEGNCSSKELNHANRIPNADNTRTLAAQTVNALLLVIIEIKGKSKGTVLMFETEHDLQGRSEEFKLKC